MRDGVPVNALNARKIDDSAPGRGNARRDRNGAKMGIKTAAAGIPGGVFCYSKFSGVLLPISYTFIIYLSGVKDS